MDGIVFLYSLEFLGFFKDPGVLLLCCGFVSVFQAGLGAGYCLSTLIPLAKCSSFVRKWYRTLSSSADVVQFFFTWWMLNHWGDYVADTDWVEKTKILPGI